MRARTATTTSGHPASVPVLAGFFCLCAVLPGCAAERPQSTFTPGLDTGITSSDGGAVRALGGAPGVAVTTPVAPARRPVTSY